MTRVKTLLQRVPLCCVLSVGMLFGQGADGAGGQQGLWASVREAMRKQVANMSSYTCIQNIARFESRQDKPGEKVLDAVRMQVMAVHGKESYSWPGSPNAVSSPGELLKTGLIGTGVFQGYAYALFVSPGPGMVEFVGREMAGGEALLHFRFAFDSLSQKLVVTMVAGRATLSAKGEFWVAEKDHLLRRMRIESASPAPEINVKEVVYLVDWAPVRLRTRDLLLPQNASMFVLTYSGEIQRNDVSLSQCREFQAESAVRFDAGAETGRRESPPAAPAAAGFLPEGLEVPMRLLTPIDTSSAAVGDAFEAEVTRDVKRRDGVLLHKGDRVSGRIRRIGHETDPERHTLLMLEVTTVVSGGKEYVFLGEVTRTPFVSNLIRRAQGFQPGPPVWRQHFGTYTVDTREFREYGTTPGVAVFLFRGDRGALPAGYEMEWRTLQPRSDGR